MGGDNNERMKRVLEKRQIIRLLIQQSRKCDCTNNPFYTKGALLFGSFLDKEKTKLRKLYIYICKVHFIR